VPRPLVLAHRGASRRVRENTIDAFAQAMALGADGVELDVHRTADDHLVVHHDAELAAGGVLAEQRLREIRAAAPFVPTLDEVLDTCPGRLVNIEIKNLPGDADFDRSEHAAELVVAVLTRRGGGDDVLVSSFNLATVDRVRALDPSVPTALLTLHGFDPLDALPLARDRGHAALHPDVRSLVGPVAGAVGERATEIGIRVNVWTVNDPDEVRRLAAAGVDGIVTDVPDVALRALRGRRR
jgi:glycerophosphoryl diester phosphodiesterase